MSVLVCERTEKIYCEACECVKEMKCDGRTDRNVCERNEMRRTKNRNVYERNEMRRMRERESCDKCSMKTHSNRISVECIGACVYVAYGQSLIPATTFTQ